jgi:hypothetical protein
MLVRTKRSKPSKSTKPYKSTNPYALRLGQLGEFCASLCTNRCDTYQVATPAHRAPGCVRKTSLGHEVTRPIDRCRLERPSLA